jgi:hypothetical protein
VQAAVVLRVQVSEFALGLECLGRAACALFVEDERERARDGDQADGWLHPGELKRASAELAVERWRGILRDLRVRARPDRLGRRAAAVGKRVTGFHLSAALILRLFVER